jgi:hypothetical protein
MPHPLSTPDEIYRVAHRSTDCSPEEAHTYALGVVFEAAGAGRRKIIDNVRDRTLHEAATAVMQMQEAHVHYDLGTVVNKLAARDVIIELIEKGAADV